MFVLFSVLFFDYSGMAAPRKKDRFFLVCARGGAFEACAAFVAQASLALYRANSEYRCRLPLRRSARAGTGRARGCVASRIRRTSRGCCRMRRGVAKAAHTKMGVCARRTIRGYDRPRACVHGQAAADRCGRSPVKTVKCDDGRGNPDGKAKVAGDRPSVCLCSASGTLGLPCRTAHTARAPAVHSPPADSSRPRPPGRDRASYPRRPRQAKAGSTLHGEARQGKTTQGTARQGKAWASLVAFPPAAPACTTHLLAGREHRGCRDRAPYGRLPARAVCSIASPATFVGQANRAARPPARMSSTRAIRTFRGARGHCRLRAVASVRHLRQCSSAASRPAVRGASCGWSHGVRRPARTIAVVAALLASMVRLSGGCM